MHVVLLGSQGSGKGTQAKRLARHFRLAHIETGALLRSAAQSTTALGRKIDHLMNVQGKLVPDAVVVKALREAVRQVPVRKGIAFDGYPRTIKQARILDVLLRRLGRRLTHVIYLPLSAATTIQRLSLRRTCQSCGTPWILGKTLSRSAKRCPACGGNIIQRHDDKPTTIRKRLAEYVRKTAPIVGWYRQRGILIEVDGEPSIDTVWKNLLRTIR